MPPLVLIIGCPAARACTTQHTSSDTPLPGCWQVAFPCMLIRLSSSFLLRALPNSPRRMSWMPSCQSVSFAGIRPSSSAASTPTPCAGGRSVLRSCCSARPTASFSSWEARGIDADHHLPNSHTWSGTFFPHLADTHTTCVGSALVGIRARYAARMRAVSAHAVVVARSI